MASRISGITVQIGADTQKLTSALADVNKQTRNVQSELKQVERLLKLDPSNTELLAQKQTLLSDAISNTTKKLDTLKTAEKQVQEQFEKGEIGESQYRALQREVISTEKTLENLEKQLKNTNNKWESASKKIENFGNKATSVGKTLTKTVTTSIVGIGAASMAAWKETDEAFDIVIKKTGATGEALDGLEKSFRNVAKEVPADMSVVGEAIGEINTQFGFTDKKLEETSALMVKFADINEQDVTSSTISAKGAIEAFELSAEDLDNVLDSVTKTAQNTGVGTDKLFDSVVQGAPQLKSLNLNFAQSVELMGNLEQNGLDTSKTLSYLARAQVELADEGKTLEEGLIELTQQINDAKTETDALSLSSEYFGTKGASFMLEAIQRGVLDFEDLADASVDAMGTVTTTFEETKDPVDDFTVAFNNLKLVASDIGEILQEKFAPVLKEIVEGMKSFTEWFGNLDPEVQNTILVISGILAVIGPLLIFVGKIASGISALIGLFGGGAAAASGIGTVLGALAGPIGIIVAAIAGLIALFVALWKNNEEFRDNVKAVWSQIQEIFSVAIEYIDTIVSAFMETIKAYWERNGEDIKAILSALWQVIQDLFNAGLTTLQGILDVFLGILTGDWERAGEGLKQIWQGTLDGIVAIFQFFAEFFQNAFNIFSNDIAMLWENLGTGLKEKWSGAWTIIDQVITLALETIKGVVDSFIALFNGDWQGFTDGLKSTWSNMWTGIADIVSNAWSMMFEAFFELRSNIQEWFLELASDALDWGKELISNFVSGIKDNISSIGSAISSGISKATSSSSGGSSSVSSASDDFYEANKSEIDAISNSQGVDLSTAEAMYKSNQIIQNIEINSPTALSPYEIAQETKKASQQLALGM